MRGIVLSGTGGVWQVLADDGVVYDCALRGRVKQGSVKLAVGDLVELERAEHGDAFAIAEILPRRSQLARRAPGGGRGERIVVANVDQVVVVFAMVKPAPHTRMLDRFLVIAEANELAARVVVNKVDLASEAEAAGIFADYPAAGYPMHFTSTKHGTGLESLHDALHGRTSVLTGPSGVGKSSLLNALYPGLRLRVGEISESVNKGRHTTVGALLHPLPDGGFVADTPGLREIGMWGLDPSELDECFPEFRPLTPRCRFGDCTHTVEPECAVLDALSRREISAARHESYVKLRQDLTEAAHLW
ncbi:MAG TPA: ribosome small subunit-dependent GTPase A [Gemmatimonadaceae bacterium]|jgi:ribosome biogenesis GTPase|nr:ribosome small subunit-dependent GTPase A [Gemmatimonadaceae bacterium]